MAEITAKLVKELREKSGVGMMDAKKALVENNGDMDASMDWLRTKGLAKAAKKADRVAAEGLVAVASSGTTGSVIEVNSETDFVSRNEQFQGFVGELAGLAAGANGDVEALKGMDYPGAGKNVGDQLTSLISTIGENMSIRRTATLSVSDGSVASYVHNSVAPGMGKIGVLVALESAGTRQSWKSWARVWRCTSRRSTLPLWTKPAWTLSWFSERRTFCRLKHASLVAPKKSSKR